MGTSSMFIEIFLKKTCFRKYSKHWIIFIGKSPTSSGISATFRCITLHSQSISATFTCGISATFKWTHAFAHFVQFTQVPSHTGHTEYTASHREHSFTQSTQATQWTQWTQWTQLCQFSRQWFEFFENLAVEKFSQGNTFESMLSEQDNLVNTQL